MSTILKYSSSEADQLFERLNAAEPAVVISELEFITKSKEYDEGEVIFEYDSDHNHAWYLLGLAYEALGNKKEAALCFVRAIKIYPSDADAYVAYSNTEDKLEEQVTCLEIGLRQFEDPRVRLNLANALLDLNQPRKALFHLEQIAPGFKNYSKVVEAKEIASLILDKRLDS